MREYPELGELLVEVSLYARRTLADGEDLGYDVVLLPAPAPCLAWNYYFILLYMVDKLGDLCLSVISLRVGLLSHHESKGTERKLDVYRNGFTFSLSQLVIILMVPQVITFLLQTT